MTAEERERARRMLDLQEGLGPVPVLDRAAAIGLLASARRIAVVGASPRPGRPSLGVMRYLLSQGYDCVPINPNWPEVLGRPAYRSLEDAVAAGGAFDIVDVFRRADRTAEVARAAVATGCRGLWLQLGIVDWEAARIAHEGGLEVVMDRCTAVDHRFVRR